MKRVFLLIAMICMSLAALCANKVFAKYADMKDAEFMNLNVAFMRANDVSVADALAKEEELLVYSTFIDKIDEMQMIKTKGKTYLKEKKDIKTLRGEYEEIISYREGDISVLILYGATGNKREFVCHKEMFDDSAVTVVLVGDLTMQDVGKLVKLIQSGNSISTTDSSHGNGALSGQFSISTSKTVQFSQGNLLYQASTQTWRFADNQYDYIGMDNRLISESYDGWIDLFGFGTGDNPTNASRDNDEYEEFTDWGNNTISNGGTDSNCWRSLSFNEWYYLFWKRGTATSLFGMGTVNGVCGIIILPDNWKNDKKNPSFVDWESTKKAKAANPNVKLDWVNKYDKETWAKMETLGAVFLPCAGFRQGTGVYGGEAGNYATSAPYDDDSAYSFGFNASGISLHPSPRSSGYSVRLIRDCE